jgi:hypothetical protein
MKLVKCIVPSGCDPYSDAVKGRIYKLEHTIAADPGRDNELWYVRDLVTEEIEGWYHWRFIDYNKLKI